MSNLKLSPPPGELAAGLHDWERYIYDEIEAENWSGLKRYSVPSQAKWAEDHPEETDTEALAFGRKAHLLILQPEIFYENYICIKKWSYGDGHLRKTKTTTKEEAEQNRIEKIAWEAEYRNHEWVDRDEWKQLHDMKAALEADKVTGGILLYPYWKKEVTCLSQLDDGTWTKSMFDMVAELDEVEAQAMFDRQDVDGGVWIGDYKTARSAAPDKFKWAIRDFKYKEGACFYLKNYERATGVEPAGFFWFAQDKYGAHTPCVYLATYDQLQGCDEWEWLLKRKRECKKTDLYPGYAECAIYLPE